jgi:ribonuclease Z
VANNPFKVTILGCSSAIPVYGRFPSAQVLQHINAGFLIDCGEGTQMQLNRYRIKPSKINHIFISHLHGDHYFGLIGLITSLNLLGRKEPIEIFAPKALRDIIQIQLDVSNLKLRFPIHFHALEDTENPILETNGLAVYSFPVEHRIPCWGFAFVENQKERKYNKVAGDKYDIPVSEIPKIKKGADFTGKNGETIKNQVLTFDPERSRKYVYITDSRPVDTVPGFIQNTDLLYHETTFLHEAKERAFETYHSTTKQAGEFAHSIGAQKLLIGHFSAKYKELDELLFEARESFSNTELAIEGKSFSIDHVD